MNENPQTPTTTNETLHFIPHDRLHELTIKPGNRVIDPQNSAHVKRIADNMKMNGFSKNHPIIITSTGVVEEGNHRVYAGQYAGVGVWARIDDNYNFIEENHINDIQKRWSMKDWITLYAREKRNPYPMIKFFIERHPELGVKLVHTIFENKANHMSSSRIDDFKSGNFSTKVTFDEAEDVAKMLNEVWDILPQSKRTKPYTTIALHFGFALLAMFATDGYDHAWFLSNLKKKVNDPNWSIGYNRAANMAKISEIYNYCRRNGKIHLAE